MKLKKKPLRTKRFVLDKKMVVQVRYYEKMYTITDTRTGERVFSGFDEPTARKILGALKRAGGRS